jgi:hypothetical protein
MRYVLYLLLAQLIFAILQVYASGSELSHLENIKACSLKVQGTVTGVSFERTKTTRRLWYDVAVDDCGGVRKVNTPGYLSNQVEREYNIGEAVEVYLCKERPCLGYMFVAQMQNHHAETKRYYLYFACITASACLLLIAIIKFKGGGRVKRGGV